MNKDKSNSSKKISISLTEEEWIRILDGEYNDTQGFETASETIRNHLCRDGHDPEIVVDHKRISSQCRRHCGQFDWSLSEFYGPTRFRYISPTFLWEFYEKIEDIPYPEVRKAWLKNVK